VIKFGSGNRVSKVRDTLPSIFFSRFKGLDSAVLDDRIGSFSGSLIKGVAHRCSYGFPQVVLCESLRRMKPFPTTFWLVCPFLERIIGRLESDGGVQEMERASGGKRNSWRAYHLVHALLRLSLINPSQRAYLRCRRRAIFRALCERGIGGLNYSSGKIFVKCLHLQVASYLALRRHPMSEWLAGRVGEWKCRGALCASTE
jgi:hypothetical protein